MQLDFVDHRSDPSAWAKELDISREAIDLYLASDVIDLHIDGFIWTRIFGYDLTKRHGNGLFDARFYGHADLPRLREAHVTGGIWVITTNRLRPSRERPHVFSKNVARLQEILEGCKDDVAIVRTTSEYKAAQRDGKHAAWIGIQGGNALDGEPDALDRIPDGLVVRVTIVHLSNSGLGETSAPVKVPPTEGGLTKAGKEYVQRLNAKKIFVDLAHISRRGFFDAVEVHDKTQPLIVTHTGVSGVYPHWRNVDDEQLRAIADTGGAVGVMYQDSFLAKGGATVTTIVEHLEHIGKIVGDDVAALGSDWDGAIVTPRDMKTCLELPRIVDVMLKRKWSPERIKKVLGGNFLRALTMLRG
jgi:membrane dipeptidase